jgi:peroxiredoxin Q/BCP
MASFFRLLLSVAALLALTALDAAAQTMPAVGQAAPDFRLPTLDGDAVQLSKLTSQGPVVLVVLRGFPGYQCPACNAQTGQLLASAAKFAEKKAQVVLVYPGSPPELAERAKEFASGKTWPDNFHLAVDQAYALTNLYGLRWNAPNETAYPSTYVVNEEGKIVFAKTSKSHGGRASTEEVLKALTK